MFKPLDCDEAATQRISSLRSLHSVTNVLKGSCAAAASHRTDITYYIRDPTAPASTAEPSAAPLRPARNAGGAGGANGSGVVASERSLRSVDELQVSTVLDDAHRWRLEA